MKDRTLADAIGQLIGETSNRKVREALEHAKTIAHGIDPELTDRVVERMQWQKPVKSASGRMRINPANEIRDAHHPGLHVIVTQRNTKVWKLRIRRDGQDKVVPLGEYPKMRHHEAVATWEQLQTTGKAPVKSAPKLKQANRNMTLSQLVERYINLYKDSGDVTERVAESRAGKLRLFVEEFVAKYGDLPSAEVTATHVRPVVLGLKERKTVTLVNKLGVTTTKTRGGPQAYKEALKALSRMQKVAMGGDKDIELIEPWLPADTVSWTQSLPRPTDGEGRALRKDERAKLLTNIDNVGMNESTVNVVKLMLLAGMRISEALSLTHDDMHLDDDKPYIVVNAQKINERYELPMSREAVAVLRYQQATMYVHVFTNQWGRKLTVSSAQQTLAKYRDALGLGDAVSKSGSTFSSHWLRHTLLSIGKAEGFGKDVRDAIAHHTGDGIDAVYTGTETAAPVVLARRMVQRVADILVEEGLQLPSWK